ncbi:MAG: hypothetical protein ABI865_15460, partial [Nitrosospira sp.]
SPPILLCKYAALPAWSGKTTLYDLIKQFPCHFLKTLSFLRKHMVINQPAEWLGQKCNNPRQHMT